MTFTLLPVLMMLAGSMGVASLAQAPEPRQKQTQQDEYTRVELMPEIGSLTVTHEVAVTTPGATEWTMPLRHGLGKNVIAVTDMMTGQPLKFTLTPDADALRVTLARPIAGEGGQARLRVTTTGRTQISFMRQYPGLEITSMHVRAKADAQTGDAAKPRPLATTRSWEPPPAQDPTERARLSERASQDRDIVYFLQPPETHAFSLYHDYTESREGAETRSTC